MRTAWALLCLLCSGCASYEYELTQPPPGKHIGADDFVTLDFKPLRYRLRTVENRLVMLIDNPTADSILLVGERSVIVDPAGGSHPLLSQTIAPGTYIKLILPPFAREVYESNPTLYSGGVLVQPGAFDWAGTYEVFDDSDATFFRWEGETDLRMTLCFEDNKRLFQQTLAFGRRKVR
jgi:hypothetical protein